MVTPTPPQPGSDQYVLLCLVGGILAAFDGHPPALCTPHNLLDAPPKIISPVVTVGLLRIRAGVKKLFDAFCQSSRTIILLSKEINLILPGCFLISTASLKNLPRESTGQRNIWGQWRFSGTHRPRQRVAHDGDYQPVDIGKYLLTNASANWSDSLKPSLII